MVLRWGVFTAAKICHDFVNAFNSCPFNEGQVIAAIAARDVNRAKEFAKTHNIPKVFDSYKALAESKDIDVAYIGSLHPQHFELARLCLNNGKHVLCEKPLCLNYSQAKQLVDLARQKNLFLMEAVWSRFFPIYIELEKAIAAGKLGEVKFVQASFGIPGAHIERLSTKAMGGSALLDLGIYVLQFAQYIFKEEPINIVTSGQLNSEGVDISESIILEYKGGRRAVLNVHSHLQLKNTAEVVGTKGSASLGQPFHCPTELKILDEPVIKTELHDTKLYYNFDNSSGLVFEAIEVKRCIENGLIESPRMSHNESLVLAKLMDAIRKQLGVRYDVD